MLENWQAKEEDVDAIAAARQKDPFAVLGPHLTGDGWVIRAFVTDALGVRAIAREAAAIAELGRRKDDFFEALIPGAAQRPVYRLEVTRVDGVGSYQDAYAFGLALGPLDDYLLVEASHEQLYRRLGAQLACHERADGVVFAVWTPDASRVSVVGDFNQWDGRRCQMRKRIDSGLWEIFVPRSSAGAVYKYEIVSARLSAIYAARQRASTSRFSSRAGISTFSACCRDQEKSSGVQRTRRTAAIASLNVGWDLSYQAAAWGADGGGRGCRQSMRPDCDQRV